MERWLEEKAEELWYYTELDRYFTDHTGEQYDFEEGYRGSPRAGEAA